uniref:G_PROTEIN_RECEP_F1_2 domain-containing protein n=1 Tax=Parastrongyloides trichosuri TaxID=131310 RepID=A0A0N4Z7V5_PARTI
MNNTSLLLGEDETVEAIEDELHQLSVYELAIWCFLYTVIAFLAVFGNVLVMYITLKPLYNRSVTNLLIVNLAIADIITGLLAIPFKFHAALFQRWFWPDMFCKLVPFIETLSLSVSVFTLCTSALSELSQLYFIKSGAMNLHGARKLIFIIWLLAFIVSLPYGMFHEVIIFELSSDTDDTIRQCIPRYGDENWWKAYNIYLTIIHYFVPLIIVDSAYTIIAINVYRNTKKERNLTSLMKKVSENNLTVTNAKKNKLKEGEPKNGDIKLLKCLQQSASLPASSQPTAISSSNHDKNNTIKNRRKIVTMLILVVTFFTLCWLPLETYLLLNEVQPQINEWRYINVLFFCCHWLAMSNSCFNPIIYGLYNDKYKQEYRKIFNRFLRVFCNNSQNSHTNYRNCEKKYSMASTIVVKSITNKPTVVISTYNAPSEFGNSFKTNETFHDKSSIETKTSSLSPKGHKNRKMIERNKKLFLQDEDSLKRLSCQLSHINAEIQKISIEEVEFLGKKKKINESDYVL